MYASYQKKKPAKVYLMNSSLDAPFNNRSFDSGP